MGVKIDRSERRIAHGVFSPTIMQPVVTARNQLDWVTRVHKAGFTPGELKKLQEQKEKMIEVHEEMLNIFFRLKH